MPYIKQDRRKALLKGDIPMNPGELNFLFSTTSLSYLLKHGTTYQNINDIIGALEGCKLELYARVARPYEDNKIKENGDIF